MLLQPTMKILTNCLLAVVYSLSKRQFSNQINKQNLLSLRCTYHFTLLTEVFVYSSSNDSSTDSDNVQIQHNSQTLNVVQKSYNQCTGYTDNKLSGAITYRFV